MNYQAAIFDMDGLLLDTERVCQQSFIKACQTLSLPFLQEVYLGIIGQNAQGIEKTIRDGYGETLDYTQLRKTWMSYYHEVVEHHAIPVKEGVIELLEWFQSKKIPMAVATSTDQKLANVKLQLAGLSHYFTDITSGCEVTHGKPHPEIYLLAAKRLNIAPQECLGFEDSNNGVRSGVAAGLQMFQIPDLVSPEPEIVSLEHAIEPSLTKVLHQLKK